MVKAQPRGASGRRCSTAFGCSIDGVVPTAQDRGAGQGLADAGVDEIMLADTVGYAHPAQVKEVVSATREAIGACCTACTCTTPAASASPTPSPDWKRAFAPSIPASPAWRVPLRARSIRQRRDRGPGLHAGEHGLRHRDRSPEAAGGACLHEGLPAEPMHGQLRRPASPAPSAPRHSGHRLASETDWRAVDCLAVARICGIHSATAVRREQPRRGALQVPATDHTSIRPVRRQAVLHEAAGPGVST